MNFPLIARYLPGLKLTNWTVCSDSLDENWFISQKDLEAALEKGVRVEGNPSPEFATWFQGDLRGQTKHRSHSALLIGIQEIQPESAEDILREFVPLFQRMFDDGRNKSANMFVFLNKAKALLSRSRK